MSELKLIQSRTLVVLIIVASAMVLLVQKQFLSSKEKYDSVNIYSAHSRGLNYFKELTEKINSTDILVNKQAFLSQINLSQPPQLIFILAPKIEISQKESETLTEFVLKGGKLFISATTKAELVNFTHLFSALNIRVEVEDDPKFKNKFVQTLIQNKTYQFARQGSELSIYSPIQFKDSDQDLGLEKYFRHYQLTDGVVYLNLGLPLFSNGLISLSQNRKFAYDLIDSNKTMMFDEYHHMFMKKTYGDMAREPVIVLPLLGMLILVVIFLMFSDSTKVDKFNKEEIVEINYHKLNSQVIHGIWKSKNMYAQALESYRRNLLNRFPNYSNEITQLKSEISKDSNFDRKLFLEFLALHKKILNEKGIK